jgi:hypothetical protein
MKIEFRLIFGQFFISSRSRVEPKILQLKLWLEPARTHHYLNRYIDFCVKLLQAEKAGTVFMEK